MKHQFIGKYRVIEEIGSGGMAVVYKCYDEALDRPVAVKLIHPNLARNAGKMARFRREARAAASLDHQNIVRVYDYISDNPDCTYIVTEYIEGMTLRSLLSRDGSMLPELAAMVGIGLCRGLERAHWHGIVHRDIKPENVMVREDGLLKLMDFGVAHIMDVEQTKDEVLVGSLAYMSPEQAKGVKVDGRSDIFSIGILLYEMTTGRHPFREEGMSPLNVLEMIHKVKYPPLDEIKSGLSMEMVSIIDRCLEGNPDGRYKDVRELGDTFVCFLADIRIHDYQEELKSYLDDPVSFNVDFRERVGRILYDRGKQCLEQGRSQDAYRLFNRALCSKEGDQKILSLLKVSGRLSLKRRALFIGAALAVIFIFSLSMYLIYSPFSDGKRTVVKQEDVRLSTEKKGGRTNKPKAASRKGFLEVYTRPWVKVYIDGDYRGNTPIVREFELIEGEHILRLENPFCSSFEDAIEIIPEKPLIKRVQLKGCKK